MHEAQRTYKYLVSLPALRVFRVPTGYGACLRGPLRQIQATPIFLRDVFRMFVGTHLHDVFGYVPFVHANQQEGRKLAFIARFVWNWHLNFWVHFDCSLRWIS